MDNIINNTAVKKQRLTTRQMTAYALMAALMCVLGPLSVQIGPIPISFTNLVIYFAAFIIGTKGAMWSYTVYFMLGCFGLPVFSNFSGGLGKVVGPTGGFLVGFFITAFLSGLVVKKLKNKALQIIGLYLATFVSYALGTVWFALSQRTSLAAAFAACVLPFLIGDLLKAVISALIAPVIANRVRIDRE